MRLGFRQMQDGTEMAQRPVREFRVDGQRVEFGFLQVRVQFDEVGVALAPCVDHLQASMNGSRPQENRARPPLAVTGWISTRRRAAQRKALSW